MNPIDAPSRIPTPECLIVRSTGRQRDRALEHRPNSIEAFRGCLRFDRFEHDVGRGGEDLAHTDRAGRIPARGPLYARPRPEMARQARAGCCCALVAYGPMTHRPCCWNCSRETGSAPLQDLAACGVRARLACSGNGLIASLSIAAWPVRSRLFMEFL